MPFNWNAIYAIFEQQKSVSEFKDYVSEICKSNAVLNTIPFDEAKAKCLISELSTKYREDLNWIAGIYGNGMTVTNQPISKTPEQVKDDLSYISRHIPLIALRKEGISEALKKLAGL